MSDNNRAHSSTGTQASPLASGAAADSSAVSPGAELMVVAGESSGDLHCAHVMEELLKLAPGIRFCGLGGPRMQRVGMRSVGNSQDIGVVGLVEVLRILPRAKRFFDDLDRMAIERRPKAALLVDAPDFNLRVAKRLAAHGIPVVYYVSPQLWAWRKNRVNAMRGIIHQMLVLFPFEVEFYEQAGIAVTHVGHPLLDVVPELGEATGAGPWGHAAARGDWVVGLLPGSRNSEIKRNLPGMLAAAERMANSAGTRTRLILASSVSRELVEAMIRESTLGPEHVEVRAAGEDNERFDLIRECRLCLCASGTATLEVGLLEVPMVVSYRLAPLTHFLAKRLVTLEHVSLVNLVLGKAAVPELIQDDADPANMSAVSLNLLVEGDRRKRMLEDLSELRSALGSRGASERAAVEVAAVMRAQTELDVS